MTLAEMPFHVGNHHVFDFEFGGGVRRVNVPGCGCGLWYCQGTHVFDLSGLFGRYD